MSVEAFPIDRSKDYQPPGMGSNEQQQWRPFGVTISYESGSPSPAEPSRRSPAGELRGPPAPARFQPHALQLARALPASPDDVSLPRRQGQLHAGYSPPLFAWGWAHSCKQLSFPCRVAPCILLFSWIWWSWMILLYDSSYQPKEGCASSSSSSWEILSEAARNQKSLIHVKDRLRSTHYDPPRKRKENEQQCSLFNVKNLIFH